MTKYDCSLCGNTIDKEDKIKIYESIANAMINYVQRLKGE